MVLQKQATTIHKTHKEQKTIDHVIEILEKGTHKLTSKKKIGIGRYSWTVIYAEYDDTIILIHLGKKRR